MMIERWGWSLYDIDRTDIRSLIPLVIYAGKHGKGKPDLTEKPVRRVFADEIDL